jgi:hypothetical protein
VFAPGLEVGVGEDPAGLLDPRQRPEGERVRHQHSVRQTVELGHAVEVPGGEGRHDRVVGGVEDRGDELKVLAALQAAEELGDGERLAPDDPVLVAPGDADLPEVLVRYHRTETLGSFSLLVGPQAVIGDEAAPNYAAA